MFYTFMWFIALLLLLLVDVVYVTSFIGGYYPEFEFFYWVVELVLLIHLIFLIKRKTYTWEKLFFIDSIERYIPALCGMNCVLRQILRFCMVVYWILLPLVPTLAVALSMQLGYSLGWMSAVLCVQCVLTLLLFVVFQIKKWKLQGERNRQ